MTSLVRVPVGIFLALIFVPATVIRAFKGDEVLPPFGRDTVLVWKVLIQNDATSFIVRLAQFLPNRYFEWEDSTTQGTIFISSQAVSDSRNFITARLFEAGVDTKDKDGITLWLSQRMYRELKSAKKSKMMLDSISGWMSLDGGEQMPIEVNKALVNLPVIKVHDSRGNERWFLDLEDNPLMVKHAVRSYCQTLTSITTDRANTLRWIKGKKLNGPM